MHQQNCLLLQYPTDFVGNFKRPIIYLTEENTSVSENFNAFAEKNTIVSKNIFIRRKNIHVAIKILF